MSHPTLHPPVNRPAVASARLSVAALVAGAVAIGFAPIFVRLSEVGPSATAFWRIALALPALFAWATWDGQRAGKEVRPAGPQPGSWRGLAVVGAFFAADLAVWHWSIRLTSVANATLEANLAAVFVVAFGWLVLRERVSGRFVLALAVALVGIGILMGKNVRVSAATLRGDALGVLTAVFYAGYLLSVKRARGQGWGTAPIMAASGVVTAGVLLPVSMLSGERLWPNTGHGWAILAGLALLSHVGGQSLIAFALAGLPAAFASLGLLVQPATAALAAWALLGEGLAPGQFAGGALLLAGIFLARRESR